jgi:hypothetical protein
MSLSDNPRSRRWLTLAVVYFCIGVTLGIVMGASGDHSLFPLHAHINLLGWVSMTLFAVIGALYPATTRGRIADLQFWIYNISLPILAVLLALVLKGNKALEPVLGFSSIALGVAVLLFAYQVISAMRGQIASASQEPRV